MRRGDARKPLCIHWKQQRPRGGFGNRRQESKSRGRITGKSSVWNRKARIFFQPIDAPRFGLLPEPADNRGLDLCRNVGCIDKRIVAAAVGANGSASLRKTGCQGILLRGEVLFIEVDAKALNPLKTTSIHNAARMVESCATNPIRGGPARKPT